MNATELGAHAASVLVGRWCVEERAAMRALEDAATELDVRLADLAALVVAASLMPPDWALRWGTRVEATVARPGEGQPAIPGGDDPHDPPPVNRRE